MQAISHMAQAAPYSRQRCCRAAAQNSRLGAPTRSPLGRLSWGVALGLQAAGGRRSVGASRSPPGHQDCASFPHRRAAATRQLNREAQGLPLTVMGAAGALGPSCLQKGASERRSSPALAAGAHPTRILQKAALRRGSRCCPVPAPHGLGPGGCRAAMGSLLAQEFVFVCWLLVPCHAGHVVCMAGRGRRAVPALRFRGAPLPGVPLSEWRCATLLWVS